MGRKSSIRRQPPDVREAIGALHRQGRTLDEILDALDEAFGVKISRSALHRHVKGLDKTMLRVDRSRQIAEALVSRFGQETESKVVRANIELMHAAISELLSFDIEGGGFGEDGDRERAGPMDAMLLAKALEHLTRADRHNAELITKIRTEARKEAEAKMTKAVDRVAKEEGAKASPKEVLERIKAIYRGEA